MESCWCLVWAPAANAAHPIHPCTCVRASAGGRSERSGTRHVLGVSAAGAGHHTRPPPALKPSRTAPPRARPPLGTPRRAVWKCKPNYGLNITDENSVCAPCPNGTVSDGGWFAECLKDCWEDQVFVNGTCQNITDWSQYDAGARQRSGAEPRRAGVAAAAGARAIGTARRRRRRPAAWAELPAPTPGTPCGAGRRAPGLLPAAGSRSAGVVRKRAPRRLAGWRPRLFGAVERAPPTRAAGALPSPRTQTALPLWQ